jgi:flagellum-specific peptidoglycan hydrolase FlgJ
MIVLALLFAAVVPAVSALAAPQNPGSIQNNESVQAGKKQQKKKQEKQEKQEKAGEKEDDSDEDTEIWDGFFPWVTSGDFSDNWLTGLGLAAAGALGALILIFTSLGTFLPSMGGKADWEALGLKIEELEKRREKLLESRERYVRSEVEIGSKQRTEANSIIQTLDGMIATKEAQRKARYRELTLLGIPLYFVIGAVFAVLLASNAMQALLIGFAWTAFIDRFGLRGEEKEKKQLRAEDSEKLAKEAKDGQQAKSQLKETEKQLTKAKKDLTALTAFVAKLKAAK